MSLAKLLDQELPLNRKERFFTGTVFPMIVCRDNFKHLPRFMELIGCSNPGRIKSDPTSTNIQFFTEYSLVESVRDGRFPSLPTSKETPDILFLIKNEEDESKILVALEAKMYVRPSAGQLQEQMQKQKPILDCICESLKISQEGLYHLALIPDTLFKGFKGDFTEPVITWELIRDAYKENFPDDYFLEMLNQALKRYDDLVSEGVQYGKNCEQKITGKEIKTQFERGGFRMKIMGRDRGLSGQKLENDIISGRWEKQLYESSSSEVLHNRNWFPIGEFIDRIDQVSESKFN